MMLRTITAARGPVVKRGIRYTHPDSNTHLILNSGSTARDHLANERTFLAWARTGMGFLALGIGIDSLQSQTHKDVLAQNDQSFWASEVHVPAFVCVGVGGSMLVHATNRFYKVQKALLKGQYHLGHSSVFGMVMFTSVFTVGALGLIFLENNSIPLKAAPSRDNESNGRR